MSEQIDTVEYTTKLTLQPDGTYEKTISKLNATCSNPAAANPTGKVPRNVRGMVIPAYDGAATNDKTGDTMLTAAKTASGIG